LDYYLSQNGFYSQGVAQDGSNLIIPIMLNWNSDPEQDSYIDNYRILIEDIHTSHPNARIMLMGCNCSPREILATYNDTYLNRYSQLQAVTKRRNILYEQKLEALADEYSYCIHVPIMPFYNWQNSYKYFDNILPTPRDSSNTLRVYGDYVHPNLIGYGQISDILFNAICFWYLT
jgi:lysophospholipase L1-like esterase